MKAKISNSILFLLFIPLFIESNSFSQQRISYNGEIMGEVIGLADPQTQWEVNAQCLSSIRWEFVTGDCYLTDEHGTAYIEGTGNSVTSFGFKSPCNHLENHLDIAFGLYEFTFDLPGSNNDISFTLDLQDADWTGNYASPYDITIRWDIQNLKLERRIGGAGNSYYELTENAIWEILDEAPPNQEAFQPTSPKNLACTNPNKRGEHPHFTWTAPDWPGIRGGGRDLIIYYKIFRNNAEIESGITSESWTDENVGLHPSGNTYTYQVKAYLAHSPDSDPSNSVSIKGYLFKETSQGQPENFDIKSEAGEKQRFSISAYPNPFNSTTMIQYSLPQASKVTLKILNLRGELVKTLVGGSRANHNQFIWNGENEVGEQVSAGIYLCQLKTDNYSQIKRIIYIK